MSFKSEKLEIIREMSVKADIDVVNEIKRRIDFIKQTLVSSGLNTLILGISGGVDSCTLGKLAQLAVNQLNECQDNANKDLENNNDEQNKPYQFIAMRLPYGIQADEKDAQMALDFINPSIRLCVNIEPSVNAMELAAINSLKQLQNSSIKASTIDESKQDFVKGNLKARARMIAQYQIAGLTSGLVLGTDHSAENITGFYTKWGDGACDLAPLFGLSKRQVKQLAKHLVAPEQLINKAPTADLECLAPAKTDESVLGVSYEQIDDFLEGKSKDDIVDAHIISLYQKTQHKRKAIPTIYHKL